MGLLFGAKQTCKHSRCPLALHLFAEGHAHAAEDLAQGFKERVAEGVDAEGVDPA